MARQEKGSRLKGLPPLIRLQIDEASSGSFPTIRRTSSDNRTGNYATYFVDSSSSEYTQQSINLGSGLPSSSLYLDSELKTNIDITSSIKHGIGDKWIVRNQQGQDFRAFDDSRHPAMDGALIGITNSSLNEFFATGSALLDSGPGFQQSLRDKSKIEIDLTPSVSHSFGLTNFTSASNSFSMAYFNKITGKWEGVGSGAEPITYVGSASGVPGATAIVGGLSRFLDQKAVAFGNVIGLAIDSSLASGSFVFGQPIDNFGFPYHPKYSGSTGTTFDMGQYLSEPFLLEKIVLYFSGTYANGFGSRAQFSLRSLSTFFILNERTISGDLPNLTNQHVLNCLSGSLSTMVPFLSVSNMASGSKPYKTRDLITWMQVAGNGYLGSDPALTLFKNNFLKNREIISASSTTWSGQFMMSGVLKSPLEYIGLEGVLNTSYPGNLSATNFASSYMEQWSYSGRDGAEKLFKSGRNWKNVFESPKTFANLTPLAARGDSYSLKVNERYSKNNPYLLTPTDKLIFGWHISGPNESWNFSSGQPTISGSGPSLSFSNLGVHKIVLYGSLLRVNDNGDLIEYHDTLNQLLTSTTIHEVIG